MKFEKGEYTTQTFIDYLTKKYKTKLSGEPFNSSDVAQYLLRGYTPHRYGNEQIKSKIENGIRIITIVDPKKKNEEKAAV